MLVRSLGKEDPLEKEMATHSSILVWEIPQTKEPGGLQKRSVGSQTSWDVIKGLNNSSSSVEDNAKRMRRKITD